MIARCTSGTTQFDADISRPIHISIPLDFHGSQANAYNVQRATAEALRTDAMIGDTRLGGSCNFEVYTLVPHCNGTHTECIGHLTDERVSIHETLRDTLIPATLVSVTPVPATMCDESYIPEERSSDFLLTAASLQRVIEDTPISFLSALIIRTMPNGPDKKFRDWDAHPAPFFSLEAMRLIAVSGIRHLLTDVPSLDRASDEGKLSAHRCYWALPAEGHALPDTARRDRTVTELVYVPDSVPDGLYLLNLQIANFTADAAPSRPVLFPILTTPGGTHDPTP